jgi:hypothetical protein
MRIERRQVRNLLVTGAVICTLLGANVLTPLAFRSNSDWLVAIMLGIGIGQLNLIATWAALAPGNFLVRLPWSLLLTVWMWQALIVGNRMQFSGFPRAQAVLLGMVLLFGLFVAMAPLAIAARFFRWRLLGWRQQVATDGHAAVRVQFHLRHLLLSMFLLSLAMAMVRWILPEGRGWEIATDDELYVLLPGVAFCNVVVTIPCIWGAFASRRLLPLLAAGWFAYGALLTGVEIGFFVFFLGPPPDGLLEVFFLIYLMNLMQCLTVFGVLVIFRRIGFRLVRVNARGVRELSPSV